MTGLDSGMRVRRDDRRPTIRPAPSVVVQLGPDFLAVDAAARQRAIDEPVESLLIDTTTWSVA